MKLLFVSDSFKGSLTSDDTARLLEQAAHRVFDACSCESMPVADGGEGTTEAVVKAVGGTLRSVCVHGPLMEETTASYGVLDERRAIIEMAAASGLPMVPDELRNPLHTTTYGTGELIRDALDQGFGEITVALGGSATNDGGMGCLRALGVRFFDAQDQELQGRGADLERVARIDVSGLHPRAPQVTFVAMCDVDNPLCGPNGATHTFGPQKGASPEIRDRLERGMVNYRDVIVRTLGIDPDGIAGSGAAGGLGAALAVFLHAELKSGIQTVLDLIDFDAKLEGTSLVVTGEGRTDWQSCHGKVMQGVGQRCLQHGVPAIALCGSLGPGAMDIFDHGIDSLMVTMDAPMSLDDAMDNAPALYLDAAERMFRLVRVGMGMAGS
ncbi:MAG: glycerate kinase [Atopobiaceae bacterium]|nr:glycerate kinase [Atopobiaceae bacterium]